jgi:predicted nucleotidyltransferase
VYLFGSYAEKKNHSLSDIDIGIVFNDKLNTSQDMSNIYNELYDIFTDVFKKENIDIVFLQRTGLELKYDVITNGEVIFEEASDKRFEYEEKIALLYADFKPVLEEFDNTILNRI